MQESNPAFDAFNKKLAKNVQYIFTITGVSKKFINQISKEIPDALPLIEFAPETLTQKITDKKGKSSIGNVSIQVVDYKDISTAFAVTKLIASNDIIGADATLSVGYVGLSESEFLPIMTGRISDYTTNLDSASYVFEIEDLLRTLIKEIFTEASSENLIRLRGNPIDLILQIMTSTGNGTNGIYDLLPASQGLGIDQSLVDVAEFEKIRDNFIPRPNSEFLFEFRKPFKGIDFLEKELYAPFNMNPFIKRDGKISITTDFPKLEIETQLEFDENMILGTPTFDSGVDRLINVIRIRMDYDEVDNKYLTDFFFIEATSISRFKRDETLVIKSRGLHGSNSPLEDLNGDSFATTIALTLLSLRAIPFPGVTFDSFFFRLLSEVGDQIKITHPSIPDMKRGDRGITKEVYKVIDLKINYRSGKVTLGCNITDFSGKKFGAISTASEVNADEVATTSIFSVLTSHEFVVGDAIVIYTEDLKQETVITSIDDSAGGGGGSLNKITVSPALTTAPKAGDIVQYSSFDHVKANGTPAQQNYAYMSEVTIGTTGIVQAAPAPTNFKFTVDDASGFEPNDVIKLTHDDFFEFVTIFAIVDNQIEIFNQLEQIPSSGDTIVPEELETGDIAFLRTQTIGL